MKKIASIIILVLILASCSKDNAPNADIILLKKRVEKYTNIEFTTIFSYDGNKLVSASKSDGTKINFTYTGDFITKIEYFNAKNVVKNTFDYIYTDGKVTLEIINDPSRPTTSFKTTYGYNADGTVSYEFSAINLITNAYISHQIGKYTFENGNLMKNEYSIIYENSPNTAPGFGTIVYEYDTKHNPFSNVLGGGMMTGHIYSANNMTRSTKNLKGIIDDSPDMTSSFSYNSDDFPILEERQLIGMVNYTVQYFY